MTSLQWVDYTYSEKHKAEDQSTLRAGYYENLSKYPKHARYKDNAKMEAAVSFMYRYGRRAAISLAVYFLSFVPIAGKLVLPAASFYTFNNAVGPVPAGAIFGIGLFLPRRYLVLFLQSYFASRSLVRELVS